MSIQNETQDTLTQQHDSATAETPKETKLDRIANEAAGRAVKRQQRYDREHNIFTK